MSGVPQGHGVAQAGVSQWHGKKKRCGAGSIESGTPGTAPERTGRVGRSAEDYRALERSGPPRLSGSRLCVTGRLFVCKRCCSQVVICRACDRGHQYCSRFCSEQARCENQRAARCRYAETQRGRETARKRQRCFRLARADRERAAATQEAEETALEDGSSTVLSPVRGKTVTDHPSGEPRMPLMGVSMALTGRSPPLRCVGCGRVCTRLVMRET